MKFTDNIRRYFSAHPAIRAMRVPPHLSGLRNFVPLLALIALAVLILALLVINYTSFVKLRVSALDHVQDEVVQLARGMDYFFRERENDLRELADHNTVTAFFKSRSLGMSMQYGLRASLNNVSRTFSHYRQALTLEKQPVYARLYLLEKSGEILTDSAGFSLPGIQIVLEEKELQPGQVRVRSHRSGDISFISPVSLQGRIQGYVMGWVSYTILHRYLMGRRQDLFFVVERGKTVFSSRQGYEIPPTVIRRCRKMTSPYRIRLNKLTVAGTGSTITSHEPYLMFFADLISYPIRVFMAVPLAGIPGQGIARTLMIGLVVLSCGIFFIASLMLRIHIRNILLTASLAEAKTASRIKSVFFASMSHELRTPLNAILGYTQIFQQDTTLTPSQLKGVRIIHESGTYLLELINDILDVSKIEAGKIELMPVVFSLSGLVRDLLDIATVRARRKGIALKTMLDGNLPEQVVCDQLRLRQVLLNLLSNAIKFTDHGRVALEVRCLGIKSGKAKIFFSVQDSGPGIPEEMLEKIFIPFQQAGDRLHCAEGSGLGLSISRQLVRMMGGELEVESCCEVGSDTGSCFFFTLDLPVAGNIGSGIHPQGTALPVTNGAGPRVTSEKNVLIVDDNHSNRSVLTEMLTLLGFVVRELDDSAELIRICERFHPDLLFLGLHMPGIDGIEFLAMLKRHPRWSDLPVIALCADVSLDDEIVSRCLASGFAGYLGQPLLLSSLMDVLIKVLNVDFHVSTIQEEVDDEDVGTPPPGDRIEKLLGAVEIGDIREIEQQLADLACIQSGRHKGFVNRLRPLVDEFQMEELEEVLKRYLEKK